jgi:hypothetical protein
MTPQAIQECLKLGSRLELDLGDGNHGRQQQEPKRQVARRHPSWMKLKDVTSQRESHAQEQKWNLQFDA